jgi:hypothetical protein
MKFHRSVYSVIFGFATSDQFKSIEGWIGHSPSLLYNLISFFLFFLHLSFIDEYRMDCQRHIILKAVAQLFDDCASQTLKLIILCVGI